MGAHVEVQTISPIRPWGREKLGQLKGCFLLLLFFLLLIELGQVDAQSNPEKRELSNKMDVICFISSDASAVNAFKLYYNDVHEGHLWIRSDQDIPPCSNISPPPDGSCLVCCLEQKVYAVCSNLRRGVKVTMETDREHVEISESECPKPPSDGQLSAGVIATIVIMSIIFIIIAGVVGFKYWKH